MQIIFSVDAKQDIIEITNYTMKTWGRKQTLIYKQKFKDAYEAIQENPQNILSKAQDDILPNLRKYNVGKHAIFYRISNNNTTIEVLRILHLSMDFKRHF